MIFFFDMTENIGDSGKVVMNSAVWGDPQQQRETE